MRKDNDVQERLMHHIKEPGFKTVVILVILLAFMLACSIPADLIGRISPELDGSGEVVETGLMDPDPVELEPTAPMATRPQEVEVVPAPTITPSPEAPQPVSEPQTFYHVQPGSKIGLPNIWHKELGCNWMGIGGQVFGREGWPEDEILVVELGGTIAGETMSAITLTGTATQWGPSGYEFTLGPEPIASQHSLWVQFFDIDGNAVSFRIHFDTYDDCERNAILLNMIHVERAEIDLIYLPVVGQFFYPSNQ